MPACPTGGDRKKHAGQFARHAGKIGLTAAALVACHRSAPVTQPQAGAGTTTLDRVWVIEASGPSVRDTTLTFAAADGRTVILKHASPDDAIFAMIQFPPARDTLRRADLVHLTVHPVAGQYAIAIASPDKIPAGATVTFSYAIHFVTPAGAVAKYPNPGRLAEVISPAELTPDNKVRMITGERPAASMFRFAFSAPGTYALVVAR